MKPVPITTQVQVPWIDVLKSIEPADFAKFICRVADHVAGKPLASFFGNSSADDIEDIKARRRVIAEIHANLSEPAKRLLAEVLALEFTHATTPKPEATCPPHHESGQGTASKGGAA